LSFSTIFDEPSLGNIIKQVSGKLYNVSRTIEFHKSLY